MRRIDIAIISAAVLLGGAACSPRLDPTFYVPETAGLVRQSELVGQDYRVTLHDGRTLTFPIHTSIQARTLRVESVIVAGSRPVPWVFSADLHQFDADVPDGCYAIRGRAKMIETHILQRVADGRGGEIVIALPKVGDWRQVGEYTDGSGDMSAAGTCINAAGQAFSRLW